MGKEDGSTVTPDEVVASLIARRSEMTGIHWRVYKNAVVYFLESYHPDHATALEELRGLTSEGLPTKGVKTSARKKKHVPASAWTAINFALAQRAARGHRYARALQAFCEATLLTGLRPIEWAFSSLDTHPIDGRRILRVQNAKHSNGRANGEIREMYVDALTSEELRVVEETLTFSRCEDDAAAKRLQTAYRHELEAARGIELSSRASAQSNVTLYSFRHQFIANAKLTFQDPILIAAVVGHSSTKTAHTHYGKRRNGRGQVKVYPTESSISAVHSRHLEQYSAFIATRGIKPSPNLDAS